MSGHQSAGLLRPGVPPVYSPAMAPVRTRPAVPPDTGELDSSGDRSGSPELGLDKTPSTLDTTAMALTCSERQLLGRVRLPFGTSILCGALSPP
jgi:hypothetical protein